MNLVLKYASGMTGDWTYEPAERVAVKRINIRELAGPGWRCASSEQPLDICDTWQEIIEEKIGKEFNMGLPCFWASPVSYILESDYITVFRIWNGTSQHYTIVCSNAFIMSAGQTVDTYWADQQSNK